MFNNIFFICFGFLTFFWLGNVLCKNVVWMKKDVIQSQVEQFDFSKVKFIFLRMIFSGRRKFGWDLNFKRPIPQRCFKSSRRSSSGGLSCRKHSCSEVNPDQLHKFTKQNLTTTVSSLTFYTNQDKVSLIKSNITKKQKCTKSHLNKPDQNSKM